MNGKDLPALIRLLQDEPERFEFDAAVAILLAVSGRADPAGAIHFQAVTSLAYPSASVAAIRRDADGATALSPLIGLVGPSGVLPRTYTETVNAQKRQRSEALSLFLDLLAQRIIGGYAEAGIRYRPHRAAQLARLQAVPSSRARFGRDRVADTLLALTGHALPGSTDRLLAGTGPLLFYAGHFATWPRSVERLGAILADWLGLPVTVEQFDGTWLAIDASEQSSLAGGGREPAFNRLGVDCAIGSRAWDVQSSIRLRIGPLGWTRFQSLLPGGVLLARLAALVRSFVGPEIGFAVNPVLAAAEVPPLELRSGGDARLGWTSWLGHAGPRLRDADEARFEPRSVERAA